MRLYLSSFRTGNHPEHLKALAGQDSRRRVVTANQRHGRCPPEVRRAGAELELAALAYLDVGAIQLDLGDYFAEEQRLRQDLAGVSLSWLRGGNVVMPRYALYRRGARWPVRAISVSVAAR